MKEVEKSIIFPDNPAIALLTCVGLLHLAFLLCHAGCRSSWAGPHAQRVRAEMQLLHEQCRGWREHTLYVERKKRQQPGREQELQKKRVVVLTWDSMCNRNQCKPLHWFQWLQVKNEAAQPRASIVM